MDDLIMTLLAANRTISRYLMNEYWLDIGVLEDYDKAQEAYQQHFMHQIEAKS